MSEHKIDSPSKLPFNAPKLEVYGLARDITRNVGNTSNVGDSGPAIAGNNKTR